jgi:hypothetical protein
MLNAFCVTSEQSANENFGLSLAMERSKPYFPTMATVYLKLVKALQ